MNTRCSGLVLLRQNFCESWKKISDTLKIHFTPILNIQRPNVIFCKHFCPLLNYDGCTSHQPKIKRLNSLFNMHVSFLRLRCYSNGRRYIPVQSYLAGGQNMYSHFCDVCERSSIANEVVCVDSCQCINEVSNRLMWSSSDKSCDQVAWCSVPDLVRAIWDAVEHLVPRTSMIWHGQITVRHHQ